MKIAAVCCTHLRPKHLGYLIKCFLEQDYPRERRELVILDDAGQYDNQQGDRWRLISQSQRYPTLGEKRNAAAGLISPDVEALAVWDDDDVYLPWALSASVAALREAPWSRPSLVLHCQGDGSLKQHQTGGLFHGGWAYTREAFDRVKGYARMDNGEDQNLAHRMARAGIRSADPITLGCRPFYVYNWAGAGYHLSGMGTDGYRRLAARPNRKATLEITWEQDYAHPRILPGIHPRVF